MNHYADSTIESSNVSVCPCVQAGYSVTVFERNDRPGGLLQYGIPSMKLSKTVVARRISLLQAEGIRFQCNVDVGKDISADDLANE